MNDLVDPSLMDRNMQRTIACIGLLTNRQREALCHAIMQDSMMRSRGDAFVSENKEPYFFNVAACGNRGHELKEICGRWLEQGGL